MKICAHLYAMNYGITYILRSMRYREWYVHGRRLKGSFVLKTLDGNMLEIAPSKISRIGSQAGFIIERRPA